jgi:mannan endo-1,4-beta-mannosidase
MAAAVLRFGAGVFTAAFMVLHPVVAHSARPGFVTIGDGGLQLNGRSFHFAGINCYYLMVFAAEPELRAHVDEVLEDASGMGLSLVRTWAFNDGNGWNALQTAPGVYNEQVFVGLDYVLHRCDQLGLKVILPLVNNWVDYGGMDQYVVWSPTAHRHDDFYTDSWTRSWYRDHAASMIGRVNSFNGRIYRDDPTILAWELANEPRCPSDRSGATLQTWIEEMADHIHELDPEHLVTTGLEGFFNDSGGPWYLNGSQGADFTANHAPVTVDFATAHSWPEHWGLPMHDALDLLIRQEIAATELGKPLIVEEYGYSRDGAGTDARNHFNPATWGPPGSCTLKVPGALPAGCSRPSSGPT